MDQILDFLLTFVKSQSLQLIQKPETAALPIHVTLMKDTANQILNAKEPIGVEKVIVHQDI